MWATGFDIGGKLALRAMGACTIQFKQPPIAANDNGFAVSALKAA
jgi:hypothetical protein